MSIFTFQTSINLKQKHHNPPNYKPPLKKFLSTFFIKNSYKSECQFLPFIPASQSVAAVVFGQTSPQSRLYPLTKRRSEGAVPIAGSYRLIDAVISNCINSNISKIYALTQFNSTSLNSHLSRAYSGGLLTNREFLEVIAAYQSPEDDNWFQGTADAMRRCLWVLEQHPAVDFLVLPGNHLYKMDYQKLIEAHRNNKADVTVAVLDKQRNYNTSFGSFNVDFGNRVIGFKDEPNLIDITALSINNGFNEKLSSMGIYVMNRHVMIKLLQESFPTANDLKNEVIPGAISLGLKVHAYRFDGYWEDMRSIEAYYKANMDSTKKTNINYNFYDRDFPVYTLPRHLPPSLVGDAVITDSVIGDGCILNRCSIRSSIIGPRTRVGDGAVIEDSVIIGSDIYQSEPERRTGGENLKHMSVPIGIGEGSFIKKTIIDKNAKIGKNVKIINRDNVQEANNESDGYVITSGIVVIMRGAVLPDESIL
ncbi:inactive glucose-1-phosphate adenylyltransferase small subunit 2, chloroplastic-like [Rutidosis leptorrhynchoides]|uniref:inactive glucose-1-phosphate adenylyltransferase small subunit 2, chloroplastic-like n=1 Tax=Rutidosis leptorrhynchoides TaxID=125765 RepID=UPI003A9A3AC6